MKTTNPRHNGSTSSSFGYAQDPELVEGPPRAKSRDNRAVATNLVFGIVFFAACLAGCQRGPSINAQVQSAIADHLSDRPGITADRLLIEVETVTVQGERAEAEVIFRSRDNPESRMAYHYELRRESGAWKVENGRPSAAGSPHPGPESAPEEGATLPEGHPPVEGNPHE